MWSDYLKIAFLYLLLSNAALAEALDHDVKKILPIWKNLKANYDDAVSVEKAFASLSDLCAQNNAVACSMASEVLNWKHRSFTKDSIPFRLKACALGERSACLLLGPPWGFHHDPDSISKEVENLRDACGKGIDAACMRYAECLKEEVSYSDFASKKVKSMFERYSEQCNRGSSRSCFVAGRISVFEKSLLSFAKGCDLGDDDSCLMLQNLAIDPNDRKPIAEALRKACRPDNAVACAASLLVESRKPSSGSRVFIDACLAGATFFCSLSSKVDKEAFEDLAARNCFSSTGSLDSCTSAIHILRGKAWASPRWNKRP